MYAVSILLNSGRCFRRSTLNDDTHDVLRRLTLPVIQIKGRGPSRTASGDVAVDVDVEVELDPVFAEAGRLCLAQKP